MGDWVADLIAKYQVKNALDVGANVGGWFVPWLQHGVTTIHAIEPVPSCFTELQKTYGDNPHVHLHKLGVSDAAGVLENVNVYNAWSLLPQESKELARSIEFVDKPGFDVELITIDQFLDTAHFVPDLIKIDVDGYDAKALRGADTFLRKHRTPMIFEMSFLPKYYGDSCGAMVAHIFDMGYVITRAFASWIDPARRFESADDFMTVFPWNTSFDVILEPR